MGAYRRFKIKYLDSLVKIANYMITNFAQEVNYKSITELFGLGSPHTTENYINYLCQAYLLVGIHKFSFKAKERVRAEKMYLIDTALHSQQDNNLTSDSIGWKLENIIFLELLRRRKSTDADIYYYRTSYEIDFVLCNGLEVKELMQVSAFINNDKTFKRETAALIKGCKELKCNNLTLITMGDTTTHNINGLEIKEINVIDWLLG